MLSSLSLEEKIDLIGGVEGNSIRAIPAIHLPQLAMSDGPEGTGSAGLSTAYPGGIALAASWDPELAHRFGAAVGQDARARGVSFMLAPGVNIQRSPLNGRNFEYFGEDPLLAARMAVGYIEGVQSQGVVATVKHYAGNNSELERRDGVSSDIDERTLHELYLPAFEAAVKEAHVGAVMNAYNRVNGIYATENSELNQKILKKEWGFDGILMSDWGGTHDAVAAANAGLDLEMPAGLYMNREHLLPAIKQGLVSVETIDDKVRRILRVALRFGFFDRPQTRLEIPLYNQESRTVALDQARAGIVLLKNQSNLLPLDRTKVTTIALIGPDAWPAVTGGGGSASVDSFAPKSFLTGMADFLGTGVKVLYNGGLPSPVEIMQRTQFDAPGLKAEKFATSEFTGAPVATGQANTLDKYKSELWGAKAKQAVGIRWTGQFTAKKPGPHLLLVGAGSSDAYTLYVDDHVLVSQPHREGQAPAYRILELKPNQTIALRLDYVQDSGHSRLGLGLVPLDEVVTDEARQMARMADVVVVAAGFDGSSESEGFDRSFGLPWGQDQLIKEMAGLNPRTIVTVTSGGGVDLQPWIDQVPAILATWYPGQEGGTALAEILFGARSPEGRLPATFDRAWEENAVHAHYEPVPDPQSGFSRVSYAEGVSLGYRYYAGSGRKPLFPFGYGLSYTTFVLTDMQAVKSASATAGLDVSFTITNSGQRAGAEVAQLYLAHPAAKIPWPTQELKGFAKVHLAPGEVRRVTLHLDRRAFAYWDVVAHDWRVDPGQYAITLGNSAEDAALTGVVTISE